MRRFLTSFLIMLVILACESKVNYQKPEKLIPKEQMIDLLFDMHMAVGSSNLPNLNLEKNRNYMSLVYEKYGIDSTQFKLNNIYYTSNIEEYEEIFEEVERRLDRLKDSVYAAADSLYEGQLTPKYNKKLADSLAERNRRKNGKALIPK